MPRRPREIWRHELPGGLQFLPLVDEAGGVLAVLSSRRVVKLSADRKALWRARLGAAAAVPPVLTSDGAVAVLCADGRLRRVSSGGAVRSGPSLSLHTRRARATPLALDDGRVVVAGERQRLHVDSDGQAVARATLPNAPVGGLLQWRDAIVVTTESGDVFAWRPPTPPRKLGNVGGNPAGGGILAGSRSLVAVVDRTSVVTFDLRSGATKLLIGGQQAARQLDGPVVLDSAGLLHVASVVGELLRVDHRGDITRRLALENALLIYGADGGAPLPSMFRRVELEPSPAMVVDETGRVAFVRASGRVGVVGARGSTDALHLASERFCSKPLGIVPAGDGRMLVACRNGSLGMFADGEE